MSSMSCQCVLVGSWLIFRKLITSLFGCPHLMFTPTKITSDSTDASVFRHAHGRLRLYRIRGGGECFWSACLQHRFPRVLLLTHLGIRVQERLQAAGDDPRAVILLSLECCDMLGQFSHFSISFYCRLMVKCWILVGCSHPNVFQNAFAAQTLPRAWPEKGIAF